MQPEPKECTNLRSVLEILGDRWSVLILWSIQDKPLRFNDIQKAIGINTRTLSLRLQDLETAEMIEKRTYKEYPPRTEYNVTAKGTDVRPLLAEMMKWAEKYNC